MKSLLCLIALFSISLTAHALPKGYIGQNEVIRVERDFARNPLAIGTAKLVDLPVGFVIKSVAVQTFGTLSAGTLILGQDGGGDADGYCTDVVTGQADKKVQVCKGALVWDATAGDTNYIPHVVLAATDGLLATVGTLKLSAGRIRVYIEGYHVE